MNTELDRLTEESNEPFHTCPVCGEEMPYCNVHKEQWFYCEKDKVKQLVGVNLFSSWQHETPETWQKNAEMLSDFKEVPV